MEQQLQQNFPLVHIASHFVMGLTTDDSYLLLGGEKQGGSGYRLKLSDIETMKGLTFDSVALLSLSACETAMSKGDADGKEVDSLAAIGRQRGAQAVLATLWDVDDASTGQLMADFYRRWTSVKGISKSESLRQAQLELLHSHSSPQIEGGQSKEAGRGVVTRLSSWATGDKAFEIPHESRARIGCGARCAEEASAVGSGSSVLKSGQPGGKSSPQRNTKHEG